MATTTSFTPIHKAIQLELSAAIKFEYEAQSESKRCVKMAEQAREAADKANSIAEIAFLHSLPYQFHSDIKTGYDSLKQLRKAFNLAVENANRAALYLEEAEKAYSITVDLKGQTQLAVNSASSAVEQDYECLQLYDPDVYRLFTAIENGCNKSVIKATVALNDAVKSNIAANNAVSRALSVLNDYTKTVKFAF